MQRVELEGVVLAPDGSPAEGATVVSSAGGKAVTDETGKYRLQVELPLGASVQVTVSGRAGGNLVASAAASASVALGATGLVPVAPLALTHRPVCSPSWLPTFGGAPGTDGDIVALAVCDLGTGPALFVGGTFASASGVPANRIARWDGSSWTALGSGVSGVVRALAAFDDGSGPALYAGGDFTLAGGVAASRIARWNGSSWAPLGSGLNGVVRALAAYDDGSGPRLYAGGDFTLAGGVAASRIARWNGTSWSALGSGMNGAVHALAVHADGSGPALFVGGGFSSAGGTAASGIARWNGSSWAPLGSGVDEGVLALAEHDDGSGPALYAGGAFQTAGGVPAERIARWNGSSWAALGNGFHDGEDIVDALVSYDDGSGPALFAGGDFSRDIARWDGSSWSPLGSGMDDDHGMIGALAVYDDGSGPALFAGGSFTLAGGVGASRLARWRGSSWAAVGSGVSGDVRALAAYDDGGGRALYAAGYYFTVMTAGTTAGGVPANWIARWDGASWSALGSGVDGIVHALAVYDDGSGPALYAGGRFQTAGGVAASCIARWDGTSWSPLGNGVGGGGSAVVHALAVYDDGSGPALYAGGTFDLAGLVAASCIARWDGSSWSPLGSGVNGSFAGVHSLAVYDDGSGRALYAGGRFDTAGGVSANRIARWDGSGWSACGGGIVDGYSILRALKVHDDGDGPALYAGGDFVAVDGVAASGIARWDGSSWSALGSGMNGGVEALAVHDDGGWPELYAGGSFTIAGGVAANRIARWDGSSWSALGGGMVGDAFDFPVTVFALASYHDDNGPALLAGGAFARAFDSGDSYLARWSCPDTTAPVLSCPPSIAALDRFSDGLGEVVSFTVTATDDLDPSPVVVCTPPSGSTFPPGTTLVDCTATDASGNSSTCEFPVTVEPKARRR
jgi:HYR domain-containing protein